MKNCRVCKESKEKHRFVKNKTSKDGYRNICKRCYNERYEHKCYLCLKKFKSSNSKQKFCSRECATKSQSKREAVNQYGGLQERELKFKERFENYHPNHIYMSGYTTVDGTFKSKCLACGKHQTRYAQCARPSRKHQALSCDGCMEIAREKKRKERLVQEEIWWIEKLVRNQRSRKEEFERQRLLSQKVCTRCGEAYQGERLNSVHCGDCLDEIMKEEEELRKQWEGKTIGCHECGKPFEMRTSLSKYCSETCTKRAGYRLAEIKRRERLKKNGFVDKTISLTKLEQKSNKICAICGGKTDRSDKQYDSNGNFITGKDYPSIDHITPVSKGGTHTWDNVQLAHHYCNTIKSNVTSKTYSNKLKSEQLTLI